MSRHLARLSLKPWLACGLVVWLGALVAVRAGSAAPVAGVEKPAPRQNSSQPIAAASSAAGAAYVGNAACLGCHDAQNKGYADHPHHQASDPRTPAAKQGCETCHGAGSKHADNPEEVHVLNNFKTMTPSQVSATCTECHNRGEHALWQGSAHEKRDLSCISCHSVHSAKSESGNLKEKTQTQVCAQCHRDKAAKLDRSGHMPLREGKMECSTCHTPHGSTNVRNLRKGDSIAEMCTSCHADKRGPFLWEHAPSRDGCVTCHDPHGSSNERMLVTKTPMLCQRCHVGTRHPSTIYDQALINTSVRVYARSCVTCHTNVHGSNHPSGQFFVR
ncbi:MAG: DmsE family decaheme c-type cytochrome [Vicinamibacterales bacterium]